MIIAGEASGDRYGAKLIEEALKKNNRLSFFGFGGASLRAAGMITYLDLSQQALVGITATGNQLFSILKAFFFAKHLLKSHRPNLLILIDFPEFNLRIAAAAKRLNIPILYYVSPQIWAWRSERVHTIKRLVDHMLVILPFEEAFYRKWNIPVTFVGHPLLDDWKLPIRRFLDKQHTSPTIGLLPGSRNGEIIRHLPVMLETAGILQDHIKGVRFLISKATTVQKELFSKMTNCFRSLTNLEIINGDVESIFNESLFLVVSSGTVRLEAALYGVPMVIIYRVSPITYWVGKTFFHWNITNFGLVNLIAGKELVPELLQSQASPARIADTVLEHINDLERLKCMHAELIRIQTQLGKPGASERAADIALRFL